jgi:hypothetical protein
LRGTDPQADCLLEHAPHYHETGEQERDSGRRGQPRGYGRHKSRCFGQNGRGRSVLALRVVLCVRGRRGCSGAGCGRVALTRLNVRRYAALSESGAAYRIVALRARCLVSRTCCALCSASAGAAASTDSSATVAIGSVPSALLWSRFSPHFLGGACACSLSFGLITRRPRAKMYATLWVPASTILLLSRYTNSAPDVFNGRGHGRNYGKQRAPHRKEKSARKFGIPPVQSSWGGTLGKGITQ